MNTFKQTKPESVKKELGQRGVHSSSSSVCTNEDGQQKFSEIVAPTSHQRQPLLAGTKTFVEIQSKMDAFKESNREGVIEGRRAIDLLS